MADTSTVSEREYEGEAKVTCGVAIQQRSPGIDLPLINSTQPLKEPSFVGSAATAAPQGPQTTIQPAAALLHQTGGNQGFQEYPGPLGQNIKATGYASPLYVAWWGLNGDLTVATAVEVNGTGALGICALDPTTLQRLGTCWTPEGLKENINFAYSELVLETSDLIMNTPAGSLGAFSGNSLGDAVQNSTTVGYIEPDDTIHRIHFDNEVIENSIAVSNITMFIQTGPAGVNDHANATGHVYAFTTGEPGDVSSIKLLWNQTYDAGSAFKPGGFARGSGTSISLLGNDYLALVDHNDVQGSINVYDQKTGSLVCSVPLFSPGASAVDNGLLAAWDGKEYGLIALNDYNTTGVYQAGTAPIDGAWNNITVQSPGFTRVDVEPQADGTAKCSTRWNLDIRMKSVATISTKTGLVYGYLQDADLAVEGEYVWYAVAVDFATGEERWRVRAGSGGNFNDNFQGSSLSPDGKFIQGVQGGVVVAEDNSY
ncbi:hypothetical protein FKW77_010908 [Venturia effusa]|uniref:Uncharacterized protein n=1 Tax=Venturia effusa TaxID=50376 RepID=A0A517KYU5_9PEZI|nr:hypothetical protein FKW77_010908 [Venturia effusa]